MEIQRCSAGHRNGSKAGQLAAAAATGRWDISTAAARLVTHIDVRDYFPHIKVSNLKAEHKSFAGIRNRCSWWLPITTVRQT